MKLDELPLFRRAFTRAYILLGVAVSLPDASFLFLCSVTHQQFSVLPLSSENSFEKALHIVAGYPQTRYFCTRFERETKLKRFDLMLQKPSALNSF